MNNYDEKMLKFKENCIKNANADAYNIENEINIKIKKSISDEISKYRVNAEEKLKSKIDKIEKEYNTKIFELEMEAKKEVLNEKEKLQETLLEEAKRKVKEFTNTLEYEKYLIRNLEKYKINKNDIIGLTKKDIQNNRLRIIEKLPSIQLKEIEDKYIGGFTLESIENKIYIDNTLLNYLNEKL